MTKLGRTFAALILLTSIRQAPALDATKDGYTIVTSEELRAMISRQLPGLVVIDARTAEEYQQEHVKGAVNVPEPELSRNKTLLTFPKDARLVFYCNGPKCGKSRKSALIAVEAGYRTVYVLAEGMPVWEEKGFEIYAGPDYEKKVATNRLSAPELKALIDGKPGTFTLVDVRDPKEFAEGHIPGAVSIPSNVFAAGSGTLEKEKTIVVACNSGGRSYNAYRKLQKLAYPNIRQALVGEWKDAGFPLVTGP
jgi:rhodanese-related sulfurtransferase